MNGRDRIPPRDSSLLTPHSSLEESALEVEGAERGWLASVVLDASGEPVVAAAVAADIERALPLLLQQLMQEPLEGSIVGQRRGAALLHALADVFARRRPHIADERLFAYVHGSLRPGSTPTPPPGWDEP